MASELTPTLVSGRPGANAHHDEQDDITNWTRQGSCRYSDLHPDAWFPVRSELPEALAAKEVCHDCPVRQRCLEESMRIPGVTGIWGGWDEIERHIFGAQA